MSKNLPKDEIDLLDITIILWKKKITIICFIVLSIIIAFIFQLTQGASKIKVSTEVRPILVMDEAKYQIYNSIINTIKPYYVNERISEIQANTNEITSKKFKIIDTNIKDLEINNIDKKFLLDLFIDRLKHKYNLINLVKEFKLIKQYNYSTKFEYENAVINLASSIKLLNTDRVAYEKQTPVIIQFETLHIENWESFLKFVEKKTNSAIQKDLSSMFENYINYVKAIKQFEVEDIQIYLSSFQYTY